MIRKGVVYSVFFVLFGVLLSCSQVSKQSDFWDDMEALAGPSSLTITGKVVDAANNPVISYPVELHANAAEGGYDRGSKTPAADGSFSFVLEADLLATDLVAFKPDGIGANDYSVVYYVFVRQLGAYISKMVSWKNTDSGPKSVSVTIVVP